MSSEELPDSTSELEKTVVYLKESSADRKGEIQLVLLLLGVFVLINLVPSILALFVLSYALAVLLDPCVTYLQRRGMNRAGGTGLVLCVIGLLLIIFIGSLVPIAIDQIGTLIAKFPEFVSKVLARFEVFFAQHLDVTWPASVEELRERFPQLGRLLSGEDLKPILGKVSKGVFAGYSATVALVNLFLLPFFVFYLTRDWNSTNSYLERLIPQKYVCTFRHIGSEVRTVFLAFARGQALVALALAFLYAVALSIAGVPYAVPIGLISGLLGIIPYVGFACGIIISLLVQGAHDPTMYGIIKVLIAFGCVQFIEGNFVTPKVVGETMGLHPLAVIIALLVGGTLYGLVGMLLAIPAAALIDTIVRPERALANH